MDYTKIGPVVIRVYGTAEQLFAHHGHEGIYLKSYDLDVEPGEIPAQLTGHRTEALQFPSAQAAFETYRQVSPKHPIRPWDGLPNRPLTAFTVAIEPLEEP